METNEKLQQLRNEANQFFGKGEYLKALPLYAQYLTEKPDDPFVRDRLAVCNKEIQRQKQGQTNTPPPPNIQRGTANTGQQIRTSNPATSGSNSTVLIIVVILGGILLLGGLGYFFRSDIKKALAVLSKDDKNKKEQTDNNQKNDNNQNNQNQDKKINPAEKANQLAARGDELLKQKQYDKAKICYDSSLLYQPSEEVDRKIKLCRIGQLMDNADQLFNDKKIVTALEKYEAVLAIMPENQTAKNKIEECHKIIDKATNLKTETGNNGKIGFVDSRGYLIVDYQYDEAKGFYSNLAPVKKDGKWGFMDAKGKLAVDIRYDRIEKFAPGYKAFDNQGGVKHLVAKNTGQLVVQAF
jgi:tetratricopeptide (TPR) repeat protein